VQEEKFDFKLEKVHFMVKKGIVLSHIISSDGIEVDKAKIDLITNLSLPLVLTLLELFLDMLDFIVDLFKISVKLLSLCLVFQLRMCRFTSLRN